MFVSHDVVIPSEEQKREHTEMKYDVDQTTVPSLVAAYEGCDPVVLQQSTALPLQLTRDLLQPTTRREAAPATRQGF